MKKINLILFAFASVFISFSLNAQSDAATVTVCITNFATDVSSDCDGFGAGDSDFQINFGGDNVETDGNGPINADINLCETLDDCVLPGGTISFSWEAFEDDPIGSDAATGNQTFSIDPNNPPGGSQTASASASDGDCSTSPITYTITYSVTNVEIIPAMADNICDAIEVVPGAGFEDYAWCDDYTLEANEIIIHDNENPDKTAWFYFVAPSRDVEITTNGGNTSIGTEFALYHSANGVMCGGVNICDLTPVKDKFDYLSDHDFADDDIPLVDPNAEAAQDWDCGGFGLGPGLIPGEVYYIQMGSDEAVEGIISIAVNDDGGGTDVQPDVPCTAFDANPFIDLTQNEDGLNPEEFDVLTDCAYDDEFDVDDPSSIPNHPNDPTNNTLNSSTVWISFTAPASGRIYAEFNCPNQGENAALYSYDPALGPGCPADFGCWDLAGVPDDPIQGNGYSDSGALGGGTAIIEYNCLEPGYTYYIVADEPDAGFCDIDTWIYDPSGVDAANNNPGNDIMCQALADAQYEVPVNADGSCGAVIASGDNTRACIETLAGEPNIGVGQSNWHYFTVPASGTVEINLISGSIGSANFAVYETTDGTTAGCYGGLGCTTFCDVAPCASGSSAAPATKCCLTPGDVLAIQIDGAGGTGTYDIEINEIQADAGTVTYVDPDGTAVDPTTTDPAAAGPAIFCNGETLLPATDAVGCATSSYCDVVCDYPACLTTGYLLHNTASPTDPALVTIYGSIPPGSTTIANDGSNAAIPTCQVLYLSPVVDANDATNTWGSFCNSAAIGAAAPVVFLTPLAVTTAATVDADCNVSFAVEGGLNCFDSSEYTYELFDATGATSEGVTGSTTAGAGTLTTPDALNYVLTVTDGEGCEIDLPVDATACTAPAPCDITNGTWSK